MKSKYFFVILNYLERWPSGRRRTPGKCVYAKSVSRVRIPSSLQFSNTFNLECIFLICELQ